MRTIDIELDPEEAAMNKKYTVKSIPANFPLLFHLPISLTYSFSEFPKLLPKPNTFLKSADFLEHSQCSEERLN